MIVSEGTVYGKTYYTAMPVHTLTFIPNWKEMEIWCTKTYGESTGSIWYDYDSPQPNERWYMNNSKFWFRDKKDLEWFLLKWQ